MAKELTSEEIDQLTGLLKKLEPGFQPFPIFEQIARLVVLPIIEFVPLRVNNSGGVEILLTEPDDRLFSGILHTPGTVIRATDMDSEGLKNWGAFNRILHDELLDTLVGDPHYVGSIFHASKRGPEQAQVYWVKVVGNNKIGEFYPVDNLPANVMESQVSFIKMAADNFIRVETAIKHTA